MFPCTENYKVQQRQHEHHLEKKRKSQICHKIYLDLGFSHPQRISQSRSLRPGQVFGLFECFLQSKYLMPTKCWSGVFLPAGHFSKRTTT